MNRNSQAYRSPKNEEFEDLANRHLTTMQDELRKFVKSLKVSLSQLLLIQIIIG